jgi:two-component system sensor histidine kinase DctS
MVKISVSDSGKGIPTDIRDKIMTPFFTTKKMGQGIGLGLSLSKRIIEAHNGTFKLDQNSENTTFHIMLPKRQFQEGIKAA